MTGESTEPRSARQAFLIGPTLYLRPIELANAATAPIWDPSPYPAPVEVVEERLKEKLGDDAEDELSAQRLLICRIADDRPVGSVNFDYFQGRECQMQFRYDPNRSREDWAAIWSEVVAFSVPWLIEERNMMMVLLSFWGEHPVAEATAARLGARRCFRFRQMLPRDGQRYDWIGYEVLNPGWVARLGLPHGMEDGAGRARDRSPAPITWLNHGEAPERADHDWRPALSARLRNQEEAALVSAGCARRCGNIHTRRAALRTVRLPSGR